MTNRIETRVPASNYEDCLEAARDFATERDLDLRHVEARYEDERRETIVITAPECHCQCGAVTGERCAWHGPRAETLEVRWVPPYLRGTVRAAGTARGCTERLRVHRECGELLCASEPDWAWRSDT